VPLLLFFNLSGLLGALVVCIAAGAILALGPRHLQVNGDLAISLIVMAVGLAMEFTRLRPRFFWLPLWFIGAGMTAWHLSRILT
jgi:hypothetical protein